MREIEIKARVADKLQLLHILKSQDVALSDPITQRDQAFGIAGVDGGTYHVTDGYDVLMRKSLGREGSDDLVTDASKTMDDSCAIIKPLTIKYQERDEGLAL